MPMEEPGTVGSAGLAALILFDEYVRGLADEVSTSPSRSRIHG